MFKNKKGSPPPQEKKQKQKQTCALQLQLERAPLMKQVCGWGANNGNFSST